MSPSQVQAAGPVPEPVPVRGLVLSVVSHGHGALVRTLLGQLAQCQTGPACVVLTCNLPEPALLAALAGDAEQRPWPFALRVQNNAAPLGFAANHNQAFAVHAQAFWSQAGVALDEAVFGVINPDIGLRGEPFGSLMQALRAPQVGCAYPTQVNAKGELQDAARLLPTPWGVAQRAVWHLAARLGVGASEAHAPGQPHAGQAPDWVNAAFWLVKAAAWQRIQGFDERYFMYAEDVDWCLRLQLAGWQLQAVPEAVVMHEAQRNSRRSWQHVRWHVQSLLRLWGSEAYKAYRARARARGAD